MPEPVEDLPVRVKPEQLIPQLGPLCVSKI